MLEPINLRERFGPSPDVDAVYQAITGFMQRTLDELAAPTTLAVWRESERTPAKRD